MSTLRGCIPILCTPFSEDGGLDLESLRREIDFVIAEGASGVAALAIASEGYKLTEAERERVTETVIEQNAGRVPVVISADGAGTEVAIDRAARAARAGADAVMVLPPYFVKPDQASLFTYYQRIGLEVDVPIVIQDAPQLTGVSMGPALWARLAELVPTIQYVKTEGMPQGATISETIRLSKGRLRVFCGWGGLGAIDAFGRGAVGSMPAPNFTRLFAGIQRNFEASRPVLAEGAFKNALPYVLWAMQSIDFSVASAKHELVRRGVFSSAHQRQPAIPLDEISLRQLDRFIDGCIGAQ
ncbi:MAG: dihydrodipicolinate synthase family protein [Thermomicrobiales bacterium]